jgi:hypothetical protein
MGEPLVAGQLLDKVKDERNILFNRRSDSKITHRASPRFFYNAAAWGII